MNNNLFIIDWRRFEKGFVVVEVESRESAELTKKPWPSKSNDSWLSDSNT